MTLPDAVVRYAAHDDGLVDVHLPATRGPGPAPLAVLLHGGFWKQAYDRVHTRPVAAALAAEGYVVATPEYRRVGGGGGWPTTADDVDTAVGMLPELLEGLGVRTTGMSLIGHSAGGHLALWLANQSHPVDLVVGLAPVADLRAAARDRLGTSATQALLGGEPEEVPERYDEADPMTRLRARPSCEIRIVHGDADEVVPLGISRGLVEAHPFVDLRVVAGDHFAVIDPTSPAWPEVLDALRQPLLTE
ncbi:MAG TPA: alpha/beta hydrolase [Nocardioidaceae bacterium]|nr:alpha/beta hydrolase [Nocardioidaceae bacterium]